MALDHSARYDEARITLQYGFGSEDPGFVIETPETIEARPASVSEDLPCRGCGYNLRSLAYTSDCPECALPVGLSIRSDRLCDANPAWLGRLRLGVALLIPVTILLRFLNVSAGFGFPALPQFALYLLGMTTLAAILSGLWFLTDPEPNAARLARHDRTRRWLRAMVVVTAASYVLKQAIWLLGIPIPAWAPISVSLSAVIRVTRTLLILMYLRALARRIPDRDCVLTATLLLCCYVPIKGAEEAFNVLVAWSFQFLGNASQLMTGIPVRTYVFSLILAVLCEIAVVYLLFRMTRLIGNARRTALSQWQDITSQSPLSDSHTHPA